MFAADCFHPTYSPDYSGTVNVSKYGNPCLNWKDVYNYLKEVNFPRFGHSNFPDFIMDHNFCRVLTYNTYSPRCFVNLSMLITEENRYSSVDTLIGYGMEPCQVPICRTGEVKVLFTMYLSYNYSCCSVCIPT